MEPGGASATSMTGSVGAAARPWRLTPLARTREGATARAGKQTAARCYQYCIAELEHVDVGFAPQVPTSHRADSVLRGSFHFRPAQTAEQYTECEEWVYVSEYQYYEFQAIDQPLGEADRAALRKLSSRADITTTRFTSEYHFGDFHGNPRKLMERWFDLHLYHASWGTRTIMIRIPKQLLDASRLDEFISEVDEV